MNASADGHATVVNTLLEYGAQVDFIESVRVNNRWLNLLLNLA